MGRAQVLVGGLEDVWMVESLPRRLECVWLIGRFPRRGTLSGGVAVLLQQRLQPQLTFH